MVNEFVDRIENLQLELKSLTDNMIVLHAYIERRVTDETIIGGLFGQIKHLGRIADEIEVLVTEEYKR